ncbi:MAG: exo-alpha-sialidase [Bryobacterales bacterium]|nr:exo-alpha-sialidase [Bryobacterales bacterium]
MTRREWMLGAAAATAACRREGRVEIDEYGVLFDRQAEGFPASAASAVRVNGKLWMSFMRASDAAAGLLPSSAESPDWGRTWTDPQPLGRELPEDMWRDASGQFLGLAPFGPTARGTLITVGFHTRKPVRDGSYREDVRWRPGSCLIGRREKGEERFDYTVHPSGTFLGEQFAAPGVVMRTGRLVLQVWGAAAQGENWQCGVLLSDNDGKLWRYRQVGPPAPVEMRDDPDMPVGFNEQTLHHAPDGRLVSIIRARAKLGRLEQSPRDTWFYRSESRDGGETWSRPQPTNLAGTGAPSSGIYLPDGSLLMAARIPYARDLYRLEDPEAYGLHIARSMDAGLTWQTVRMIQQDPGGRPFNNYYNAMNGVFVRTGGAEWRYVFGEFRHQENIHRVLSLRLRFVTG